MRRGRWQHPVRPAGGRGAWPPAPSPRPPGTTAEEERGTGQSPPAPERSTPKATRDKESPKGAAPRSPSRRTAPPGTRATATLASHTCSHEQGRQAASPRLAKHDATPQRDAARQGAAQHGTARRCTAQHGTTRHRTAPRTAPKAQGTLGPPAHPGLAHPSLAPSQRKGQRTQHTRRSHARWTTRSPSAPTRRKGCCGGTERRSTGTRWDPPSAE